MCKQISKIWESFRAAFDASPFRGSRDTTRLRKVLEAVTSRIWSLRLEYVAWVCQWLCGLLEWGGGCECCEENLLGGVKSECPKKGRRLSTAFTHSELVLKQGLDECNNWVANDFGGDAALWKEAQGCTRAAFALAHRKIAFLTRVPYLLVRLDQPNIAQKALEQFDSAPLHTHHRVSVQLLGHGGPWRQDVMQIGPEGNITSASLLSEVRSLQEIPFDDSVAERPHAVCSRHMAHARVAKWPWIASSCRLDQNLRDIDVVVPAIGADVEVEWERYTSVLQVSDAKARRSKRMTRKTFERCLYHMTHITSHAQRLADRLGGLDGDIGNDGDGDAGHRRGMGGILVDAPVEPLDGGDGLGNQSE
jgi:hypothetical protein